MRARTFGPGTTPVNPQSSSNSSPPRPNLRQRIILQIHRKLRARGRSLEITKAGWILIGLTLAIGAVAINSGANLLHIVFGALLGVIVTSGVASERMLSRAHVSRKLSGSCFAGLPTPMEISLRNQHPRFPLLGISVEMWSEPGQTLSNETVQHPVLFLHVAPQQQQTLSTTLVAQKRGPQPAPRLVVSTRYPWGFFIKKREIHRPLPLKVAPRAGRAEAAQRMSQGIAQNDVSRHKSRRGELAEHRPYRPGDNPRRIDYKRSARVNHLLLREGLDNPQSSEYFEIPPEVPAGDPHIEAQLQDLCAAAMRCQSNGQSFTFVQGHHTLLSAHESLYAPQRAFEILAGHGYPKTELQRSGSSQRPPKVAA